MRRVTAATVLALVVALSGCADEVRLDGASASSQLPTEAAELTGPIMEQTAVEPAEECVEPGGSDLTDDPEEPDEPTSDEPTSDDRAEAEPCPDPDTLGTVLVGDPSQGDAGYATIVTDTIIVRGDGTMGHFADLEVGRFAHVWWDGAVMESFPVQGTAAAIRLVDDEQVGAAGRTDTEVSSTPPPPPEPDAGGGVADVLQRHHDGRVTPWELAPGERVRPQDTRITVVVVTERCHPAEADDRARISAPLVEADAEAVTITFSVTDPFDEADGCNDIAWAHPIVVDLGEPLGDRVLRDGAGPVDRRHWADDAERHPGDAEVDPGTS